MRSLASLVVVGLSLLAFTTASDARGRHAGRHHARTHARRVAIRHELEPRPAGRGQSIGLPWAGHLRDAAELAPGDGYVIRRPWRAFGTRTTVAFVEHTIRDVRARFPHVHVLAIGDLSAKTGGQITEHRSHQSGRDADIGLVYKQKPASFPRDFVKATAANLDCAATFALISDFAETAKLDGGAQMIFLDYNVQGMLYRWAQAHGVSQARLDRIFEYPHRGEPALVRHWPNHDTHMHVRFKCPVGDRACG